MPPQLVIANAPYKKYPGDVVVLRAKDWMGSSRGTLSWETDTRACSDTAVRDTQKLNVTDISSGSIASVDDTLTIDLSDIPLRDNSRYLMGFSFCIEGDWDTSNFNSNHNITQDSLQRSCRLAWYGENLLFFDSDSNPTQTLYYPRLMPSYSIAVSNGIIANTDKTQTQILHIRAHSLTGTTVEWLIDQVYFLPYLPFGQFLGDWAYYDFALVGGDEPFFSLFDGDDGADGGDNNGKFTVHPSSFYTENAMTWADTGGGDYQRKSDAEDAEYWARVTTDSSYYLANSETNEEASVNAYSVCGSYFIPPIEWVNDDFSRTVSDGNFGGADNHFIGQSWGDTPQGFTWRLTNYAGGGTTAAPVGPLTDTGQTGLRYGRALYADGSNGIMHVRRRADPGNDPSTGILKTMISFFEAGSLSSSQGAILADDFSVSGKFSVQTQSLVVDPNTIQIHLSPQGATTTTYILSFDAIARTWTLRDGGFTPIIASGNISSWWTGSTWVGWRLEIQRYKLRLRLWDASGAEPSTWDYDNFRRLRRLGVYNSYPYSDINSNAWQEADIFGLLLYISTGVTPGINIEELKVAWDDIIIQSNSDNDSETNADKTSSFYSMEFPEGTQVGEIEVPPYAQHLVFWGTRDWTELDFGDPYLQFSAKSWNPTDAPIMQRAETLWWYFSTNHGGPIDLSKIRFRSFQYGEIGAGQIQTSP